VPKAPSCALSRAVSRGRVGTNKTTESQELGCLGLGGVSVETVDFGEALKLAKAERSLRTLARATMKRRESEEEEAS
jgi:hypothetical protein